MPYPPARRDPAQAGRRRCVLPPIRTFTVGPGVPPGQPAAGCGRVADCHRRFGFPPTPEHALLSTPVWHQVPQTAPAPPCPLPVRSLPDAARPPSVDTPGEAERILTGR